MSFDAVGLDPSSGLDSNGLDPPPLDPSSMDPTSIGPNDNGLPNQNQILNQNPISNQNSSQYSFDVSASGGKQITINVLNKLNHFDLGLLGERFYDNLLVVRLNQESKINLTPGCFFLISFGNPLGNYIFKDGILFNITGDYFGILDVNLNKSKSGIVFKASEGSFSIDSLVETPTVSEISETRIETFSMKPPSVVSKSSFSGSSLTVPNKLTLMVSPRHINDPLDYIKSKYYSILYSPSIPLSYFSKTALPRLKILCKDNLDILKPILVKIFLLINQLSARHEGKCGIFKTLKESNDGLDPQYEVPSQINFLSSNNLKDSLTDPDSSLNRYVSTLKIREFQLQLIVLLELLTSLNINESDFLYNNQSAAESITENSDLINPENDTKPKTKSKSKPRRPTLVRKKNLTRKVIPTFLGMGIPIHNEEKNDNDKITTKRAEVNSINSYMLLDTLHSLIERLSLWDTLINDKNNNSLSFIAYVLVPYYKYKLPLTIKYLVDRIKSLNLKLKSTSSSSSKLASRSNPKSKSKEKEKDKLKQNVKRFERPKLNDFSSLDDKTFAPAMSFKRSNSNLSSKHLHRRQVDFSNSSQTSSSRPSISRSQSQVSDGLSSLSESHSTISRLKSLNGGDKASIFTQSKRLKPSKASKSLSQVSATPVKKKPMHINPVVMGSPEIDNSPIESPVQLRKSHSEITLSTFHKGLAPNFQLPQAPSQQVHSHTNLSPVTETPIAKRTNRGILMSPAQIESSPMVIVSSERKRKPGEPIDFQDVSVYKPLNGSPSVGNNQSESIFKRVNKRKKQ